jgi:hypothetical protein
MPAAHLIGHSEGGECCSKGVGHFAQTPLVGARSGVLHSPNIVVRDRATTS